MNEIRRVGSTTSPSIEEAKKQAIAIAKEEERKGFKCFIYSEGSRGHLWNDVWYDWTVFRLSDRGQ